MKKIYLILFFLSPMFLACSQNYLEHLASVDSTRTELKKQYESSKNKDSILDLASKFIETELSKNLFSYWEGTEWNFNGYTNVPKKGTVACGYYVSTNLKHLGLNINRYKMAQQSSKNEVLSLDPNPKTIHGTSQDFIIYASKNMTDGIYILGMSSHVGMIQKQGNQLYFFHSSPINNIGVIKEKAEESAVLSWSTIFVIGKISGNKELIKKWVFGNVVNVKLD